VIEEVASARPWLHVEVTERRLISEIAEGYHAVVMGTDKWEQVVDPAWYGGSTEARDRAVAALPPVLIAVREGARHPVGLPPGSTLLDVHEDHALVSSTLVRAGRHEWMLPEAARSGLWSRH
jgi:hypothetical protein